MFRKSSVRVCAIITLVLFTALVVLVSSQHRLRLIIGSYKIADSTASLDANDVFRYMANSPNDGKSQFGIALSTLQRFDAAHPLLPGDALPTIDQPDTCKRLLEEGKRIHCYNADIGACAILAKEDILTRLWDINGSTQLGGNGHNLLEVYNAPTRQWMVIDPYYHCYFTIGNDTTAIGFPLRRQALLHTPADVRMVRYSLDGDERPVANIESELIMLVPGAMLHVNNDFYTRYAHRYGSLMPLAPILDKLPLRASRGVRMLMLGSDDSRYIIEDAYSPHYPFTQMKWLFWSLFSLFVIFSSLTIIMAISRRRESNFGTKS